MAPQNESAAYVVATGQTIPQLEAKVRELMREGYRPTGGLFNVTAWLPEHPTLAQPMTKSKNP